MTTILHNGPMFKDPSLIHMRCDCWESKKNIITILKDSGHKLRSEDHGGVITDFHKQQDISLRAYSNDITEIFDNELEVLADILDVKNLDVTDSWFEDSNRNTYHGIHNHGGDGYSAVCFLEYDDQEHIPTQFVSSTLSAISNEAMIYSPSNVIEGDVIFFPSNTLHYTEPSESDKIRSILSWNIKF
mgnify:FL=1